MTDKNGNPLNGYLEHHLQDLNSSAPCPARSPASLWSRPEAWVFLRSTTTWTRALWESGSEPN